MISDEMLVGMLEGEAATGALAAALSEAAAPGMTILLEGPVGAGKSAFARAFITHLQARHGQIPEHVPSPTYTLVQSYEAGPLEIWHADLYRLSSTDELTELGLEEAFENAVTLIEWPDRLGELAPPGAIGLRLEPSGETSRKVEITLPARSEEWIGRIRELAERAGLERVGSEG